MSAPGSILLGHGAGGRLTDELIRGVFLPRLANPHLATLTDAAVLDGLPPGRPALTTDAFVVDPLVFPGGDLGSLSVCGTVNDLAVSGARPLWLTWAVILEEGLDCALLEQVTASVARAAEEAGVLLVAGDTKVVPRGKGDKMFATSAGFGIVPPGRDLGDHRIRPGDSLIVSGPIGDHGATILACRHGLAGEGLRSDAAPLNHLTELAASSGLALRSMHDPTRGGVVTTCHETARRAGVRLVLDEAAIPVRPETEAVAELLGVDPLYLACEGRALLWVAAEHERELLDLLRSHRQGAEAAVIGRVEPAGSGSPVVLDTGAGGLRPLDLLAASEQPRIC